MFKMVVFCNSTVFVSVFITLNRGFNFFGVVPNAPTTRRITFTGISYMFFNSLFRSLYLFILSFSLSSILLSIGANKVNNFALIFALIYYYHIRSSCLNDTISCIVKSYNIFQKSFFATFSGSCLYHFSISSKPIFLHTSQCIFLPAQSYLLLYSLCANIGHSHII